jgi:chorismate mutase/prephenate dehydratase
MSDRDLAALREQIDVLDREIVRLLNERARLAIAVGHVKAIAGRPVHDPERETEVLRQVRLANAAAGALLPDDEIVELYVRIVALTRQLEAAETSAF